jgi:hypothetical protein
MHATLYLKASTVGSGETITEISGLLRKKRQEPMALAI